VSSLFQLQVKPAGLLQLSLKGWNLADFSSSLKLSNLLMQSTALN